MGGAEHFCPACDRPTDLATPDERAQWEVRSWRKVKGGDPEAPVRPRVPRDHHAPIARSDDRPRVRSMDERLRAAERTTAWGGRQVDGADPVSERSIPAEPRPADELVATPPPVPAAEAASVPTARPLSEEDAAFIASTLRPRGVFVDVGAGSGAASVEAARRVGRSGRVIAVESDAIEAGALEREVQRAAIPHITVVCAAIHETDQLALDEPSVAPRRTLATVLREVGVTYVDLIRIDAGATMPAVLAGAVGVLSAPSFAAPVMVLVDRQALREGGHDVQVVDRFFDAERWANTTGLRLGHYRPDDAIHTRVYERR